MRKDYKKEFILFDGAETSIDTLLTQAQYNISKTSYTDALLMYAHNCSPMDYDIIDILARIAKQRRMNEVILPGAPHELPRPQQTDVKPRDAYRRMELEKRCDILKAALLEMYNRKLFTTKNHWIGAFLVIRDRLERAGFKKTDFVKMADSITPEEFPDKLRISESTMKNFTKVITDPYDRDEAYYDMKDNPQEGFCEELWNAIKKKL